MKYKILVLALFSMINAQGISFFSRMYKPAFSAIKRYANPALTIAKKYTRPNFFFKPILAAYTRNKTYAQNKEKFVVAAGERTIEINGKRQPLFGHVLEAVQENFQTQFSTTIVFRFENNTFIRVGTIRNASPEDLQHIMKNNYVYTSYFSMEKTHLSPSFYESVGAIIVGTTDINLAKELHFSVMLWASEKAKKDIAAFQTAKKENDYSNQTK